MRYYPDSKVELQGFVARHYDTLLNVATLGLYGSFIANAVAAVGIQPADKIIDLGAGSGRNALLMGEYLDGKRGKIVGLEISDAMIANFRTNTKNSPNIDVIHQRIDQPFDLGEAFDKAFIAFVIHGFPHPVRETIIQNVRNNLRPGGEFAILDFNEFTISEMPFWVRIPFTTIECKYAFDFVERDWKEILSHHGFGDFTETTFMKKYIRLLKAKNLG